MNSLIRLSSSPALKTSACVLALAALPSCTVSNTSAGGTDGLNVETRRDRSSERSVELFSNPGDNLLAAVEEVETADADVIVANNSVAGAMLNELGAYQSASVSFQPGGSAYRQQTMQCLGSALPDAVDVLCATLADVDEEGEGVQLVFIDEIPHFAQHRVLPQRLLECARDAGFQYLAIQALEEDGAALAARGYVSRTASGPYLREPQFARMVEESLELGFTPVRITAEPLCRECSPIEAFSRNIEQAAQSLITQTFDVDPEAKVLVYVGPSQAYEQPWGQRPFNDALAALVFEETAIDPYSLLQVTLESSATLGPPPASGMYLATGPDNGSCSGSFSPGSATGLSTHDGVIIHVAPPAASDTERWAWLHTPPENRMTVTAECATCEAGQRLLVQAFPPGDRADRVPLDQAICQPGAACQFSLPPGDYQVVVWNETQELTSASVTLDVGMPATVSMN